MQKRLFDMPPKPRAAARKLMHVIDAGPGCSSELEPGERHNVRFGCRRCGNETDWQLHTLTDAKRGIPCPACSSKPEG